MATLGELWDKKESNEKQHDKIMAAIEKEVKRIDKKLDEKAEKKRKKGKEAKNEGSASTAGVSMVAALEETQRDERGSE